jgi:hypothetical protein
MAYVMVDVEADGPIPTAHAHDPVDDARGNAEALLAMKDAL